MCENYRNSCPLQNTFYPNSRIFIFAFFFKVFLALYPMEVFVCSKRW